MLSSSSSLLTLPRETATERPATSTRPLISIILPAYNAEKTLAQTIETILQQTYTHWELWVVIDGGTDRSESIARTFTQDPRVHVLTQENGGVSKARNHGIQASQGEFLAFLDSDDLWFPHKLETDLRTFQALKLNTGFIYTGYYAFDDHGHFVNQSPAYKDQGLIFQAVLTQENMMIPSSVFIHRAVFDELGGFPEEVRYHEDLVFFLKMSSRFSGFPTGKRTVLYRQSLSGKGRSKILDYDVALQAYIHENPLLSEWFGAAAYEQYMRRQKNTLFYSFIMYNQMASAKQFQRYIDPNDVFQGKKGILSLISLKTGFNALYYARLVYQASFRTLLAPWWSLKTSWAFKKKLKIAVIGGRGPCNAGGIETVFREVYSRLTDDFQILIYSRAPYIPAHVKMVENIPVKHIPTLHQTGIEAFVHSFFATLDAMLSRAEILHYHAQGPALFCALPRLLTPWKKILFTCHGIDWQRKKWGRAAASIIHAGEWCSAVFPHRQVTVSKGLSRHYQQHYGITPVVIPNGTNDWPPLPAREITERFQLRTGDYLLFIGRLVPEKGIDELIQAYLNLPPEIQAAKKLVIAGGPAGAPDYEQQLQTLAQQNANVIFTGFTSGALLHELFSNAWAYVSASHLEGLPVTVLEALANGLPALLSDISPHLEFSENKPEKTDAFLKYFPTGNLEALQQGMAQLCALSPEYHQFCALQARQFVPRYYDWNQLVSQYAHLYRNLVETQSEPEATPISTQNLLSGLLKQLQESTLPQQVFIH